jgi:hypothetical protein
MVAMIGWAAGTVLFGKLADDYGRGRSSAALLDSHARSSTCG